jgi:hypothetical protein
MDFCPPLMAYQLLSRTLQDQTFLKNPISGPTIFELLIDAPFNGYPCPMCFKFEKCNPQ